MVNRDISGGFEIPSRPNQTQERIPSRPDLPLSKVEVHRLANEFGCWPAFAACKSG